ncbi:hypothetical protein AGABI2DRAFT_184434 [Agaricus bisporus var. bisporus H97]|uniref:hypothetical protein n=1 Tax=Agaricus bisporus var. bisporus (strain H97 / ATCC MYA-4626 / FGSC 10389) TaxID=936046 RepID=UPI00029F6D33|nr:hypothetical protein AGABI2DRAFT_184434 [Agaricus bisporus var. bisporus H97]EKV48063.1 hypothetical protein AGABI2DRAFT_184434 [Agaricus bisporus var. bisporus H97]
MPVPVPRFSNPPSHPVVKRKQSQTQVADLQSLTSTLPPCPTGPPAAFSTREEWIKSLPAWRREKPRRIWEDDLRLVDSTELGFPRGLTAAGDAPVIKGTYAEACLPPLRSLLNRFTPTRCTSDNSNDDDDDMDSDCGTCLPGYEDRSPGDPVSSPLGPITPFGIFVDRAVGDAHIYPSCEKIYPGEMAMQSSAFRQSKDGGNGTFAPFAFNVEVEVPKEPLPAAETVASSINVQYKKLAEPLANWIADYVWKVCTTGLSLPASFVTHSCPVQYTASPPSHLAVSVHSLLLSTLLQPSAVFLAIWYIIRLPVQFGPVSLGPEYNREAVFRAALLGDPSWSSEKCGLENNAPFRLVVLGCMLANKWLDDHTFSNKTWHSISNVPVHVINRLEALALEVFAYDLSVPSSVWSQWLAHLLSYHKSLSSPSHPQPISRPGSNPHAIIRKTIEEVAGASGNILLTANLPQPVFIGLKERRKEKVEKELETTEILEIDLDEDGPLREEYIPRRRSVRNSVKSEGPVPSRGVENFWERADVVPSKQLPPPAKWSPAGDEPILRERDRLNGHYVAVQAPHIMSYPLTYPQHHNMPYNPSWSLAMYMPVKVPQGYAQDFAHIPAMTQNLYGIPYVPLPPHSRSQSLSNNQHEMRNHARSYSQTIFEYHCSDLRVAANEHATLEMGPHWSNNHAYPAIPPFGPIPALHTTWLRT